MSASQAQGGTPTALYRFFDSAGELLYVGISVRPWERWKQHREEREWWADVSGITLETLPSRHAALDAELRAIQTENPRHNVAGLWVNGWARLAAYQVREVATRTAPGLADSRLLGLLKILVAVTAGVVGLMEVSSAQNLALAKGMPAGAVLGAAAIVMAVAGGTAWAARRHPIFREACRPWTAGLLVFGWTWAFGLWVSRGDLGAFSSHVSLVVTPVASWYLIFRTGLIEGRA